MDDEIGDLAPSCDNRICESCKTKHTCERCVKNTHICRRCGRMSHECDICGSSLPSLASIKRHQAESKICRKARMMTQISLQDQVEKFNRNIRKKHNRINSCPVIITTGQLSIIQEMIKQSS